MQMAAGIQTTSRQRNFSAAFPNGTERPCLSRMRWWTPPGPALPPTDRYLLFSQDVGAVNNMRIGWEMTGIVAEYTGRTLLLPPARAVYLLDWGERDDLSDLPESLEDTDTVTA